MSRRRDDRRELDEVFGDLSKESKELLIRIENLEGSEAPGNYYILIRDEKASGTDGGTFTSGAWQTRTLNTESVDTGGFASLAANQITLAAGTYRVQASAPGYRCGLHQVRLQNITDGSTIAVGTSEICNSAAGETESVRSWLSYRFTLAASKVLELQHQCSITRATDGFGRAASFGTEVFSVIEFWKE